MTNLVNEKVYRFEVPAGKRKQRIDVFLANLVENATRSKVQKMIEEGRVTVNGKQVKASYSVQPFDKVVASHPIAPRPEENAPEDIPLNIIYEDDYLLVVNKEAGMVAHPAYANYTGTLVNALLHHVNKLSTLNDAGRPGIVHRIDKDTSGLLVVAKDDYIHAKLAAQFAKHTIEREYWAICWGKFKEPKGELNKNIVRSKKDRKKFTVSDTEGKHAVTFYEVLEEFEFASLIKCNLKTGRTHQIRVHLSSINHPIFGDSVYGGTTLIYGSGLPKMQSRLNNLLDMMPRQALHAKTLGFIHPKTNEFIRFDTELPKDMERLVNELRK